ncbi:MAG: GAF domain-containing protein [Rhodanobacteraceae bacterium]|nr:GAF domain-containing protein [Rhodanobacteraceae bacterium]
MMNSVELSWIYDLYLLAHKTAQGGDVAAARDRLLRHIAAAFDASSGSLAEINEDRTALIIIAGIDLPPQVLDSSIPLGTGILGWAAEHAEPLLLNGDLASDPRFKARVTGQPGRKPRSAMCWPLLVENQAVGVISVNRGREQAPFSMDDLNHGYNLIRFVAIALGARSRPRALRPGAAGTRPPHRGHPVSSDTDGEDGLHRTAGGGRGA